MKPFWRYGRPGKERLIVKAFEEVKKDLSWEDEEAALLAVHQWLKEKGYLKGDNKQKSQKFQDPYFFWHRKNYDKFVALVKALLQQEFYNEIEEEAKAYQTAMQKQMCSEIDAERRKLYEDWPPPQMVCQRVDTWKDEFTGSFGSWALRASVAYMGGVLVLNAFKGKKK